MEPTAERIDLPEGYGKATTTMAWAAVREKLEQAPQHDPAEVITYLEQRGLPYTTWQGWQKLDAHEIALGEAAGRKRVKVVVSVRVRDAAGNQRVATRSLKLKKRR